MSRRRVLTDAQVREIRLTHIPGKRGFGYTALANKYGVGISTIRDVLTQRTKY